MKKLVVAGSLSVCDEIKQLVDKLSNEYDVLNYPKKIEKSKFDEIYPQVRKKFFEDVLSADVFLLFNQDKGDTMGYIGPASFGELSLALAQKLTKNADKKLYLYRMPDESVACFGEIKLWLKYGWLDIWQN